MRARVEDKEQFRGVCFDFHFKQVPGIDLRSLGLQSKHLQLLIHLFVFWFGKYVSPGLKAPVLNPWPLGGTVLGNGGDFGR